MLWYLAVINLAGFLLSFCDKRAAAAGKRRVPERTLFSLAFLGGAPGMYLSMRVFRHKTLHRRFMLGLPAMILLQAGILWAVYHWAR